MSKLIALLALGFVLAVGGCQNKDNGDHMGSSSSSEPKKMSMDACTQCAGHQTATADGKCPKCGMKAQM
jgi:hypothetical protein